MSNKTTITKASKKQTKQATKPKIYEQQKIRKLNKHQQIKTNKQATITNNNKSFKNNKKIKINIQTTNKQKIKTNNNNNKRLLKHTHKQANKQR